jgi:hypothetical protein
LRWAVRASVPSCGPAPITAGQLDLDQRLVQRLGGGTDAAVDVGKHQCLEELKQSRLVPGHRVAFL